MVAAEPAVDSCNGDFTGFIGGSDLLVCLHLIIKLEIGVKNVSTSSAPGYCGRYC